MRHIPATESKKNFNRVLTTMNYTNGTDADFISGPLKAFFSIIASAIIIENLFAIFILIRSVQLSFNIRSLSICLACSDFAAGVMLLTPQSVFKSAVICKIRSIIVTAIIIVSFLNVSAISMDISASLMFPFKYGGFAKSLYYKMVCFSLWLLGILFGTLIFYRREMNALCIIPFDNSIEIQIQTYTLLVFILWNIIMYTYISIVIRKNNRNTIHVRVAQSGRSNLRQTLKLTAIVMTFILCYLPHTVLNILLLTHDGEIYQKIFSFRKVGFACILLNSTLNPILFVFRFRECRYHMVNLLCSCFNKRWAEKCKPIPSVDLNLQETSN